MTTENWSPINLAGRTFGFMWETSPGTPWAASSAYYMWQSLAVPLRSTSAIGAVDSAGSIIGADLEAEYQLGAGRLLVGEYEVHDHESGRLLEVRTSAVWADDEVGIWTDVGLRSDDWLLEFFEHIAPMNVSGYAVASGAKATNWSEHAGQLLLTIDGLGLFDLDADAIYDRPPDPGLSVRAGELFRDDSRPEHPAVVLVNDEVYGRLTHFEVSADDALAALEQLVALTTSGR
ncbi:MAG: hypothetical protein WD269_07030 [Acidimicrobiia bacterium]